MPIRQNNAIATQERWNWHRIGNNRIPGTAMFIL
jgi:hypothetical protein